MEKQTFGFSNRGYSGATSSIGIQYGQRSLARTRIYGPHKTVADAQALFDSGRKFHAITIMAAIDKRERRAKRGW